MALAVLGDPAAVQPLLACLQDQHEGVRSAACAALGALGDPTAQDGLSAALADPEVRVQKVADLALKQFGGPVAGPLIARLYSDDSCVREAVARVLEVIAPCRASARVLRQEREKQDERKRQQHERLSRGERDRSEREWQSQLVGLRLKYAEQSLGQIGSEHCNDWPGSRVHLLDQYRNSHPRHSRRRPSASQGWVWITRRALAEQGEGADFSRG